MSKWTKEYKKLYMQKYRKENKEKIVINNIKWFEEHPHYFRDRYRKNPKMYLQRIKKYDGRHISFLGKQILYTFRQQTGYCSRCPNNVFNMSCKRTHMHHLLYVPIMPWACRIELCVSCHGLLQNKQTLV